MADFARVTQDLLDVAVRSGASGSRITQDLLDIGIKPTATGQRVTQDYVDVAVKAIPRIPSPLPPSVFLREVEIGKRFQETTIPGAQGAMGRSTDRDTVVLKISGPVVSETPEELRATIDAIRSWLDSPYPIPLSIFPEREILCRLAPWSEVPKWPGVVDLIIEISFEMLAVDPYLSRPVDGTLHPMP